MEFILEPLSPNCAAKLLFAGIYRHRTAGLEPCFLRATVLAFDRAWCFPPLKRPQRQTGCAQRGTAKRMRRRFPTACAANIVCMTCHTFRRLNNGCGARGVLPEWRAMACPDDCRDPVVVVAGRDMLDLHPGNYTLCLSETYTRHATSISRPSPGPTVLVEESNPRVSHWNR